MSTRASQITSLTIVYSIVYSGTDERKHQSSASLVFVWWIHRSLVNSPHKGSVTRKMFPFDDVIMILKDQLSRCFLVLHIGVYGCFIHHRIRPALLHTSSNAALLSIAHPKVNILVIYELKNAYPGNGHIFNKINLSVTDYFVEQHDPRVPRQHLLFEEQVGDRSRPVTTK